MVFESSLAPQATQFAESLNVKPAPSVEKTEDEQGREARTPGQGGDSVTISEEARALIAVEESGESEAADEQDKDAQDQVIDRLEARIEKIEEEIRALEESDLPEKEKLSQIQDKQVQLMELQDQLLKAQQEELKLNGMADGGGTRANGFGNSVADF